MHAKRGVNLVLSMRIRRILCFIFFFFLVKLVKRDKKECFGWFRRVHGSRCKIKVEERADSPFVLNPEASARVQRYTVFEPVHPGGRRAPRSAY